MLRPATPLTVLFLAAFILLLLSTLSAPLVKSIPLGSYAGYTFGAWGYCQGTKCSGIKIGYSTNGLFGDTNPDGDFTLPASTRKTLSTILIVHPVAAFLALVCTALAFASHFRGPSHSPRYLLGLSMLCVLTLLVSLLAVIVDILLFTPHVAWGGWMGLGSSGAIFVATVVTCVMRRTLVGRKERRKRIQENSEMNGQTYFENRQAEIAAGSTAALPRAESPPPLSGSSISPGYEKKGPAVSAFDLGRGPEDRMPLVPLGLGPPSRVGSDYNSAPPSPRRDQYGNPLPPPPGMMGGQLRNMPSNGSMRSQGSNRGGYGPRGRGGFGPGPGYGSNYGPGPSYGPPPNRGGYRGGMRGGPNVRGGPNMRGGPGFGPSPAPYGFNGNGNGRGGGMGGPPRPYQNRFYDDRDQGYGNQNYQNQGYGPPQPDLRGPPVMMTDMAPLSADNHGPIGQAVEMDERSGIPSPTHPPEPAVVEEGLKQQAPIDPVAHRDEIVSPSSDYSQAQPMEPYQPPRAQWVQKSHAPLMSNRALSPIAASPSSSARTPPRIRTSTDTYLEDVDPQFAAPVPPIITSAPQPTNNFGPPIAGAAAGPGLASISMHHTRNGSYGHGRSHSRSSSQGRPRAYSRDMPGPNVAVMKSSPTLTKFLSPSDTNLHAGEPNRQFSGSNESLPEGQRSPAESEGSHFTSVSQRGVNPNWQPGRGYGGSAVGSYGRGHGPSNRGGNRRNEDVLLNNNPDFSLPGMIPPGRGPNMRGRGGMLGPGPARGGGSLMRPGTGDLGPMGAAALVGGSPPRGPAGGGRYPGP